MVLGIQTPDGEYHGVPTRKTRLRPGDTLLLYARQGTVGSLDQRGKHIGGKLAHVEAVSEQKQREREAEEEAARDDAQAQQARRSEPGDSAW